MANTTTHVVAPLGEHLQTIILLHGRDSNASEFAGELFESQASDERTLPEIFPTARWVFPSSKVRNSARFGTPMSQWFDMWSVEDPSEKEEIQLDGLRESISEILEVVRTEARIIPPERIILGGISQGCAAAIHALLSGEVRVGGFIGLSTWLPLAPDLTKTENKGWIATRESLCYSAKMLGLDQREMASVITHASNSSVLSTPVFLAHCEDDDIVPWANGMTLFITLRRLGMHVSWNKYEDGGHWINEPKGVDDIVFFIREIESKWSHEQDWYHVSV